MTTIHTLDLHHKLPGDIAAYLVESSAGPILIECGPAATIPALETGLLRHGYRPADVRHLFVTHIHLDHAGAAGWLARHGAHVYVHARGAAHLIDPSRLLASARRIYGEMLDLLWGPLWPLAAEQLTPLHDGQIVTLGDVQITAIETPGHARHHHAFLLGDVLFTGDAAGMILNRDMMSLPAPPPEFDREAWLATLDKIAALAPRALYPTHFGRQDDVAAVLATLRALIVSHSDFIAARLDLPRAALIADYSDLERTRLAAVLTPAQLADYFAFNPVDMSVDGITRYWRTRNAA